MAPPPPTPRIAANSSAAWCKSPGGTFLMGVGRSRRLRRRRRRSRARGLAVAVLDRRDGRQQSGIRRVRRRDGLRHRRGAVWLVVRLLCAARSRGAQSAAREGVVPGAPWWLAVDGACWRAPEGPDSSVEDRADHPVVHVSWRDARLMRQWCGKRLPTEAEWERAARGGLQQAKYPWGDELRSPKAGIAATSGRDAFPRSTPARTAFWEPRPWTRFRPTATGCTTRRATSGNGAPTGGARRGTPKRAAATRQDPRGPASGEAKVIRGGSYLCHASYCNRYRVAARTHNNVDSSTGHMGFRCAADVTGCNAAAKRRRSSSMRSDPHVQGHHALRWRAGGGVAFAQTSRLPTSGSRSRSRS